MMNSQKVRFYRRAAEGAEETNQFQKSFSLRLCASAVDFDFLSKQRRKTSSLRAVIEGAGVVMMLEWFAALYSA